METVKEEVLSESEDIPSDFFDDFNKDEFMEGLSVIDSWDDEDTQKPRAVRPTNTAEVFDSVKDLRELIHSGNEVEKHGSHSSKYKWERRYQDSPRQRSSGRPQSASSSRLDDFIKPGSRRDINKTNEAIKRDKEEKVKNYLAKHLESSDDLRPPGTELDDYFDDVTHREKKKTPAKTVKYMLTQVNRRSRSKEYYEYYKRSLRCSSPPYSPRRSPHRSPRRSPRHSPGRRRRQWSPHYVRFSHMRRSPIRFSPKRHRLMRHSPRRHSPPRNVSPRLTLRHHSRSPYHHRKQSDSHSARRDTFLYPKSPQSSSFSSSNMYTNTTPVYSTVQSDYVSDTNIDPNYAYQPELGPTYTGSFGVSYNYAQSMLPTVEVPPTPVEVPVPQPQPVPAPTVNPVAAPSMVPPPSSQIVSPSMKMPQKIITPLYDPLAQLVADGKLSQEDYLKLAPNKGVYTPMDPKTRVTVLNRCNTALMKLEKLLLPNHLAIDYSTINMINQEQKSLAPKFCSPLKRQATVVFNFTKGIGDSTSQQNKQLVDDVITALGLAKIVGRTMKKPSKNMKDVAVQTIKPYCDVCEIRDSTTYNEIGTSIDPEHFSSSIYTQVIEKDLVSSKAVFNPTGSMSDGAPISIAHMTPAQLVSQLAARAKTFKAPEPSSNQFSRRNQPNNYDYDNTGNKYNNDGYYRY